MRLRRAGSDLLDQHCGALAHVCDPAQPISIIFLGPDHHRFSFMLGADEDPEIEHQPDRVWKRVSNYLQPSQAELIRAATYTFRSLVARDWRLGRIVLAGDAAHQCRRFLGRACVPAFATR